MGHGLFHLSYHRMYIPFPLRVCCLPPCRMSSILHYARLSYSCSPSLFHTARHYMVHALPLLPYNLMPIYTPPQTTHLAMASSLPAHPSPPSAALILVTKWEGFYTPTRCHADYCHLTHHRNIAILWRSSTVRLRDATHTCTFSALHYTAAPCGTTFSWTAPRTLVATTPAHAYAARLTHAADVPAEEPAGNAWLFSLVPGTCTVSGHSGRP